MEKGFVIDSLPRCGSTTVARILSRHPAVRCLIEPFHPRRYEGNFHRMAMNDASVNSALNLIWHRWNGIKHVWEASNGWPFRANPALNHGVVLNAGRVVILERRNLLRRYVSGAISQQLEFWIGTRDEFLARLESVQLRELNPSVVAKEILNEKQAMADRAAVLMEHNIPTMHLSYEEVFGEDATDDKRYEIINNLLAFLGYAEINMPDYRIKVRDLFDKDTYQWASAEIYRRIPGIDRLNGEIGSNETGWLF